MADQLIRTIGVAVLAGIAGHQMAAQRFELASVKEAAPSRSAYPWGATRKLGLSADNGRIDLRYISLMELLTLAFGVEPYQIEGPGWLGTRFFDISAIAPPGTGREQIPAMLQDLLADRFDMQFHRETRMAPVYALVVGPSGADLRPGIPDDDPDRFGPIAAPTRKAGPNGTVSTASARTFFGIYKLTVTDGVAHYEFPNLSMAGLAQFLSQGSRRGPLDLPVVDLTELTGRYQVSLEISLSEMHGGGARTSVPDPGNTDAAVPEASDPNGSRIPGSLAKQGIRLVQRSVPTQKVVIDSIARKPTSN